MTETQPARQGTQKSASTNAVNKTFDGFTHEELAAMKSAPRSDGCRAPRPAPAGEADGESDVLAKIAEMREPDRAMAERPAGEHGPPGTDEASVAVAVEQVGADPGRSDVLVNNAGITSGLAPTSQVQVRDLRRTYQTFA